MSSILLRSEALLNEDYILWDLDEFTSRAGLLLGVDSYSSYSGVVLHKGAGLYYHFMDCSFWNFLMPTQAHHVTMLATRSAV